MLYILFCLIIFFPFLPRACKSDLKSWVIVVCLDRTIFVWFVKSENCSFNRTIFAKYSMPLCYAEDLVIILAFKPLFLLFPLQNSVDSFKAGITIFALGCIMYLFTLAWIYFLTTGTSILLDAKVILCTFLHFDNICMNFRVWLIGPKTRQNTVHILNF